MPRESVFGTDEDGFAVKVGWSPNGSVQVSVGGPVSVEWVDPPPPGASISTSDSRWVPLDRRGCNDLIRKLRQARDAAFGGDA